MLLKLLKQYLLDSLLKNLISQVNSAWSLFYQTYVAPKQGVLSYNVVLKYT